MKPAVFVLALIALATCLVPADAKPRAEKPLKIAMTSDKWTTQGSAEFVDHLGVPSIQLDPGNLAQHIMTGRAILNDFSFANGTIEYDVDPTASMGAEIEFRRRDDDTSEDFYLRPRANCDQAPDCIQYAPQTHGMLLWDLFPQYQSAAPLRMNEWNHIKLVISGQRLNVIVNGQKSPALQVGRLEGDSSEGGIALLGPGIFANLVVTPDAVDGLPAKPEADPTSADQRFVRNWRISPFYALPADKDPVASDLPASPAAWPVIRAERGGLVNITRLYGLPLPRTQWSATWLKTTITSDKRQTKRVDIGWAREIWVFVNGQLVYSDKNLYQPPQARKTPDGRLSMQNGSFALPLNKGRNEIDVALADNFYGWGLIMHLDGLDGLALQK